MEFKNQKNIFSTSEASLCFTQSNWLDFIHYTEIIFFDKKCDLFICFKNIFYHVALENIFKILNNSVYFQIIAVCNEPFRSFSL